VGGALVFGQKLVLEDAFGADPTPGRLKPGMQYMPVRSNGMPLGCLVDSCHNTSCCRNTEGDARARAMGASAAGLFAKQTKQLV
jgi:hypothetical protein